MAGDAVTDTGRRVISDLAALRALAHPERSAILKLLMSGRPRTATECAAVVGASPSACSYHLRQLERFGFVERDDASPEDHTDGRTRHWRAAAVGFSLGRGPMSDSTPAERAVFGAVMQADRIENDRLARQFAERVDELPADWQDAAEFANYELSLTAEELAGLVTAIDDLLRPHRVGVKASATASTRTVHVAIHAFPRTDEP